MQKHIFVVMPFVKANERDNASLTKFFEDVICYPIQNNPDLNARFRVTRSSTDLSILNKIVEDLAHADYVICDLSGPYANPNVMFELGVRFAVSEKPVILIREKHTDNQRIFDVAHLYAHEYVLTESRDLEKYLIKTLIAYDDGALRCESPILQILNLQSAFWMQLPIRKASAFLGGITSAAEAHLRAFTQALAKFVSRSGMVAPMIDPLKSHEAFPLWEDNAKAFETFNYSIASIPSLDSYLSSVYLLGLVDDEIEKLFREYAMAYSLHFNRGNSGHFYATKFDEYHAYSFQTLVLMNLARSLIRALNSKAISQERLDQLDNFKKMISVSKMLET